MKINKMVVASLRVTKLPVAYYEYQVYSGAQIDEAVLWLFFDKGICTLFFLRTSQMFFLLQVHENEHEIACQLKVDRLSAS